MIMKLNKILLAGVLLMLPPALPGAEKYIQHLQ